MDRHSIYKVLPHPLKNLAASAWGYYLRWWRYSSKTEALVEQALERERWTEIDWDIYIENRLKTLLEIAVKQVPYYRNQWQKRRAAGDKSDYMQLSNWPVLKKTSLRENLRDFLVEGSNSKIYYIEHTSGTTGTPIQLYQSRSTLIQWYSLFEARVRRWNQVSSNDPWAIIGGRMVTPFGQRKPPYWVWNQASRQLYMSSYHISDTNAKDYVSALKAYKIRYLVSYPSSLTALAESILRNNINLPPIHIAISNAEPLFDFQRDLINKAFRCPVINTYGMSELVCGASECNQGSLHLWPEAGIIEVMDDEKDLLVPSHLTGRFITTGLLNTDMPLIRYESGDRGSLLPSSCACGRHLPIIHNIEGRIDDVVTTRDGRKIGRLDPVFKQDIPILEAQIVQEDFETVRVYYVPGLGYDHDRELSHRLHEHLGEMKIILVKVDQIPRGSNGKFKAVISKVKG